MRQHRRVSFAAPFVMVVTAACGGPKTKGHDNPPDPKVDPSQLGPEACKQIQNGERCATDGDRCEISKDCGLNGFECTGGKWQEQMTMCNPPPAQTGG
jgi:hypothetical protein